MSFHIGAEKGQIAKTVLMPGDPLRAKYIAETFLEYYSIKKYFKDYECSGNTGFSKDTNIKMILERNNIAKAVYIGDTIKDYESANKNGLPFIWAEYGFGECNVYHKKISDVSDLLKLDIF